jgi:hypothetical protein
VWHGIGDPSRVHAAGATGAEKDRSVDRGAGWARLYYDVSLIDCASKEVLEELLATTELGAYVVRRLSDRCVVVDGRQKAQIQRCLAHRPYPCRIVDLPPRAPARPEEGKAR